MQRTIIIILLLLLDISFCDSYKKWILIGRILHSINIKYFVIWNNWSKNSSKYDYNYCLNTWNNFRSSKYTIDDLHKIAHDCNPKLYYTIFNKSYDLFTDE